MTEPRDYLAAGTRRAWTVHPREPTVVGHRQDAVPLRLGPEDQLAGGDVLPGFSLPVAWIFAQ